MLRRHDHGIEVGIMGHRLSRIYTRTGDNGTTGLGDGSRTDKDSLRVEAFGTVDELNSVIGMLVTHELPAAIKNELTEIQNDLFDIGGELCIPGHSMVADEQVVRLESLLDSLNDELEPLKEFILPGGTSAAAVCHFARTVCRRADPRRGHRDQPPRCIDGDPQGEGQHPDRDHRNESGVDGPPAGRPTGFARKHRAHAGRKSAGLGDHPGRHQEPERFAREGDGRGEARGRREHFPGRRGGQVGWPCASRSR